MNQLVATVLFWVLGGYALRKVGWVRPEASADFNQVVFALTLPALVFTALHGAKFSGPDLALPLVAWVVTIASMGGAWAVARALALGAPQTGAFVLAVAFGNTTYMGYPILSGLFPAPQPQLPLAILYDQLGTTFAVNTLGAGFASLMGGHTPHPRALALKLLRFPPLWALLLGLLCSGLPLPGELVTFLAGVGALTIPLMLLTMGLNMRLGRWREAGGLVLVASLLKLVAMPLFTWGLVTLLGLPAPHRQAAVLEAAMPTMFYALALAVGLGLDVGLVINTIVCSMALSALTLPLWHWVMVP